MRPGSCYDDKQLGRKIHTFQAGQRACQCGKLIVPEPNENPEGLYKRRQKKRALAVQQAKLRSVLLPQPPPPEPE